MKIILFTTKRKARPSTAPIFKKIASPQQDYVHLALTELIPNRFLSAEYMDRN